TVSASLGARRTRRRVARQAEDEPAGLVPPEEVVVGVGTGALPVVAAAPEAPSGSRQAQGPSHPLG
ncbi:hypothetical protein, partial [Rothia kristinae]